MTFDEFCFTLDLIKDQLNGEKRTKGFKVKLNDGNTIEFYLKNPDYDWRKLFITKNIGWGENKNDYGFLSVSILDPKTEDVNLYTIPCEYINYINVVLIKEKDNIDNKLIGW